MARFLHTLKWLIVMLSAAAALAVVVAIGVSDYYKLEVVASASWKLYLGQGHLCWFGYAGGDAIGVHVRGPDYVLGLGGGPWRGQDIFGVRFVEIPLRALLFPTMLAALSSLVVAVIPGRGRRPGSCAECGYCLVGNVTGVCPECGTHGRRPPSLAGPLDGTRPPHLT
ncbi:MAG: hypothetical protein LC135_16175 [Phycisphaerae bacterium]|jgi:hypothetical protein|nr:hypothetical protein [Phycisphaerae bacterium]MCZ2401377.1 hypothetical protein [Phycisphaerae bacterium]